MQAELRVHQEMQAELAAEAHLVMQVELAVQAQFVTHPQGPACQAAPSAGGMQSRQSANGRPDARW